jgi:hypothetical protein
MLTQEWQSGKTEKSGPIKMIGPLFCSLTATAGPAYVLPLCYFISGVGMMVHTHGDSVQTHRT